MRVIRENKFYIIMFVTLTVLFSLFPLSGDDLGWATSDGMNLLKNGFEGYNGRYLGNLSVLLFSRFDFLRPIVKSSSFLFLIFMLEKFAGESSSFRFLACAVLLIPYSPFIQSVVWSAGFFNYTFSLCFILPCFYILFNKRGKRYMLLIFILGVAGQLFMETYTLLTIIVAICVLLKKKGDFAISVIYLLSCISGAFIMFSNSAYWQVLQGEDKYQSKADSVGALGNLFLLVPRYVLYACIPATVILVVIFILNRKKKFVTVDKPKLIIYILLILGLALPFCVVGPIGTRCFVGVNLILLLIIKMLLEKVDYKRLSAILLAVVLCVNFAIYSTLYISNQNKIETISQAVSQGQTEIELEHTKLRMFAHGMDDEERNRKFSNRFCEYYGLPKDIKIIFK